jgi:hypothetical protein
MHAPIQPIAALPKLHPRPQPRNAEADAAALLGRGLVKGLDPLLGSKPFPPGRKITSCRPPGSNSSSIVICLTQHRLQRL